MPSITTTQRRDHQDGLTARIAENVKWWRYQDFPVREIRLFYTNSITVHAAISVSLKSFLLHLHSRRSLPPHWIVFASVSLSLLYVKWSTDRTASPFSFQYQLCFCQAHQKWIYLRKAKITRTASAMVAFWPTAVWGAEHIFPLEMSAWLA